MVWPVYKYGFSYYFVSKNDSVSHSVMSDCATPWTVALQAPLSMEFSRQEYWSGLPCPPPGDLTFWNSWVKASESCTGPLHMADEFQTPAQSAFIVCVVSLFSCVWLCKPMDCSPPVSSVHGILQQEYWSGLPCPSPGELPDPGIKPVSLKSPALAGGFFTTGATY